MWFDSQSDLLPGLLPAMFRGVQFFVPNISTASGRRVAEYLFPGVDLAGYDDFGLAPAEIAIEGLIVGDDYVAQAASLVAAFETPGPATFVHPWLGPMTVIMREPGQISFAANELGVARVSANFVRVQQSAGSFGSSTLTGLLSAITDVATAATSLLSTLDSRLISATRQKAASRSHRVLKSAITGLSSSVDQGRLVRHITAVLPSVSTSPKGFDAAARAVSDRIARRTVQPAVSPSAEAVTASVENSADLVAIGLNLAEALTAACPAAPSPYDLAMLIGGSAHLIGGAARQGIYTVHDSRSSAIAYKVRASSAVDALAASIETLSLVFAQSDATALRRALRSLHAAIGKDVSETIGRLPTVHVFTGAEAVDAFHLAQHLAGNRPADVEAVYRDIVARNRPRHPAIIDGARVEVAL